jgi:hypothetical protein
MATPIRFTKKADFLAALEALRPAVRDHDAETLKAHKREEREAFQAFRVHCRELAKLPYEELKRRSDLSWRDRKDAPTSAEFSPPTCPRREEADLDRVIRSIATSTQESFTLNARGIWSEPHRWLTASDENERVC